MALWGESSRAASRTVCDIVSATSSRRHVVTSPLRATRRRCRRVTSSSTAARRSRDTRAARTCTATQNAVAAMPSDTAPSADESAAWVAARGALPLRHRQALQQRQRAEEEPGARRDAGADARDPRRARHPPLELEELFANQRVALALVGLVERGQQIALPCEAGPREPSTAPQDAQRLRRRGRPRGP